MPRYKLAAIAALLLWLAACSDSAAPTIALVGAWDLIGFTDGGVPATTTGTWSFETDSSFSVSGTVSFPGEPTDSLVIAGTYVQHGNSVQLTIGAQTGAWTVTGHSGEVVLTEVEPPPANTIALRRR